MTIGTRVKRHKKVAVSEKSISRISQNSSEVSQRRAIDGWSIFDTIFLPEVLSAPRQRNNLRIIYFGVKISQSRQTRRKCPQRQSVMFTIVARRLAIFLNRREDFRLAKLFVFLQLLLSSRYMLLRYFGPAEKSVPRIETTSSDIENGPRNFSLAFYFASSIFSLAFILFCKCHWKFLELILATLSVNRTEVTAGGSGLKYATWQIPVSQVVQAVNKRSICASAKRSFETRVSNFRQTEIRSTTHAKPFEVFCFISMSSLSDKVLETLQPRR